MRRLKFVTFNVLADAYLGNGLYRYLPKRLFRPGARIKRLVKIIKRFDADVIGLQEVERPLVDALTKTGLWNLYWTQKEGAPDGCLLLVRKGVQIDAFRELFYQDGSGHVIQLLIIGSVTVVNTHIKWDVRDAQLRELLMEIGIGNTVLLGDFNIRPHEPARELLYYAGFTNVWGNEPTAFIANREGPAALDILATRGSWGERVPLKLGMFFKLPRIPNRRWPSDHIAKAALIEM